MTNTTMPPSPAAEVQAAAATMLRMIQGLHISRAVYVAAKLGISDLLADGPRTTAELAQLTKAHAPSLYRVLRLLAALNVLREQPSGHFALTPLGERLRTGVPGSLRYWALLTDQLGGLRPFDRIFDTVMSGEAGLKLAYDDKWTEFLANHPHRNSRIPGRDVGTDSRVRAERGRNLRLLADAPGRRCRRRTWDTSGRDPRRAHPPSWSRL